MKKTYIQPETTVEQIAINNVCLSLSNTSADSGEQVLSPERGEDDVEWEEF